MAQSAVTSLTTAVLDVFLPRSCIACGAKVDHLNPVDICPPCKDSLQLPGGRWCPKCLAPLPQYGSACPNCHNMRLAMKGSAAFGLYRGVLRDRVIDYKFSGRRHLARTFGDLVAHAVARTWPGLGFDGVFAVPLHSSRLRQRGFDQARAVAAYAAKALAVRDRSSRLKRLRATQSQVGLTKSARMRNVKDAFTASRIEGVLTALVIDDIMTTGATLSEASRALKKAGIKRVYAAVVARAGFHDQAPPSPADDRGAAHETEP